jgi:hypothetical protein
MIYSGPGTDARSAPVGLARVPGHGDGSYEMKFVLREPLVEPVAAWARDRLPPDPHADPAGDGTYEIHSLYFDTDEFDVFHRAPGYAESKYRIRRYGRETLLYLEQKTKVKGWVRKHRTPIPEGELPLLEAREASSAWAGDWFRACLREQRLAPRCEVAYRRLARVAEVDGTPIRLTLDRTIRCAPAPRLVLAELTAERALPIPRIILELKFRHGLPRVFKELIREFGLLPDPASKYRQAVGLCRLTGDGSRA